MLATRAANGLGNGYSFGDDFYPLWLTAHQWRLEHRDLYGPEMTREIQRGLFGRPLDAGNPTDPPSDYRQFTYPAFTDLIVWPTTLLDFVQLRLLLAILLPLLTALSVRFWMRAIDWNVSLTWFAVAVVLTLSTYPALEAFFAEQPGLLVGFLLAGAALALRRNRLLLAGILTGLTLIKPQVTLLATLYLLIWSFSDRRRARFWIGFFSVAVFLTATSLAIWPHWIGPWISILLGYHRYAMPPLIGVLIGPTLHDLLGHYVIAAVLLASLAFAGGQREAEAESPTFWWTLSLLLAVTSIALLPGQAIYDHVILIPGILLLFRDRDRLRGSGPVARILMFAGGAVFFWPWIAASFLMLTRFVAPAFFNFAPIFLLPIRTAASLPFAALALLAWGWHLNRRNRESA
jgi:hypothetical protein